MTASPMCDSQLYGHFKRWRLTWMQALSTHRYALTFSPFTTAVVMFQSSREPGKVDCYDIRDPM